MTVEQRKNHNRVSTGVEGFESVLGGGLLPGSATLVRGAPGSGKSILSLYFLGDGVETGETTLLVNLGEPDDYVERVAADFGVDISSLEVLNLSPAGDQFQDEESYTLFRSEDVEQQALVDQIREKVEAVDPDRVVIDPVTEFRYLTPDEHQFRTQILALVKFLKNAEATVLLTSQAADSMPDDDLQFLVDAVVAIENRPNRRVVSVPKFRGSSVASGPHTLTISDSGMRVWPRLDPNAHSRTFTPSTVSSGVSGLDELLKGGLTTGTVTFLSGPTGVGKTTTGLQFINEAADNGYRSVLFSFEEDRHTLVSRSEAIGIPITDLIDEGTLSLVEVGPEELTVDEFTHRVRTAVEENDAQLVMIDGTTGFRKSLRGTGPNPMEHLVKIGRYLRRMGATGLVSSEVHQITGSFRATEQGTSYLADNIIVLRHVEYRGQLRKVIGVLKMRTSEYENQLRELEITGNGLQIGDPLPDLRGILTGTPNWTDDAE